MTATEFLDDYETTGNAAVFNVAIRERPRLRNRIKRFREVRRELKAKGVSDENILSKIGRIMAIIVEHLDDIAAILALVLPLFLTPAPKDAKQP